MYNKELVGRVSTTAKALRLTRKAAKKNVYITTTEAALYLLSIK